jgi:putative glycosyltransferase (TIGR04348 family)
MPARAGATSGNGVTAMRWAGFLRDLGHRVTVRTSYEGEGGDLLVALHARKSAPSVRRWRRDRGRAPVVLALTGTDLYPSLARSAAAVATAATADRIVVLQSEALRALPTGQRRKAVVIHQSLPRLRRRRPVRRAGFLVLVLSHLRAVKDPFRPALAARRLPATSRVRVLHAGAAHSTAVAARARAEERRNPRYRWLGEVTRGRALRLLASADLLVLPSRHEGGANAVSEAIVAAVPVLATRIPGSLGLLGRGHPGYFPAGDDPALARLLLRAERDPAFRARLVRSGARRAALFRPSRERTAWRRLLREVSGP